MIKTLLQLSFTATLFLVACNGNKDAKTMTEKDTKGSQTETTASSAGASSAGSGASIEATITGGDMPGTYKATCKEACCSWGIAGENVFGTQYSENGKGAKELSSVQLLVNDVKQGSKTTDEFTLTVTFGALFGDGSKSFNINTSNGKKDGSGTLTVNYQGETATVTVKGTSKEGPAINLTMNCNKMVTASNIGQ